MEIVEISNDYQIFIPSAIRGLLSLMPGQKIQRIAYDNRIELIPPKKFRKCATFSKESEQILKESRIGYVHLSIMFWRNRR